MPFGKKGFFLFLLYLSSSVFAYGAQEVHLFSIDNGMNFVLDERPGSNVAAVQFWVRVGSKYENSENAGVTHFIEHLIFKGSERLKANEVAQRIESLGGSINAFTSYDNTVYHIVIPKESLLECLPLLAEAILNPIFPEEEIEKERRVVLEEIKMGEDDPGRKLYKELFSLSYEDHPYGRPIIGFPETISRLSREEILTYFRSHYLPHNITIVIVGDIEKEKVERIVRNVFSQLPTKDKTFVPEKRRRLKKVGQIKVVERDILEAYAALSYPIPSILHEDIPVLEVISAILTEGESSRLQSELKNKRGIINGASSFVFAPEEEGLFVLQVNFSGINYKRVIEEVEKEIERLDNGISEWELKKAKNQIKASYIYGMETVQGKARMLGHYYTLTGDLSFVEKFLEKVDRVRTEDIGRVIKRYFTKDIKDVVVLTPKKGKGKGNPHYGELKNGFRYVINQNKSTPSFSFSVAFVGGVKDEPPGKNGLFNLLSKMLLKGTRKRNAFDISRSIDILAGQINPFCGYNLFGLSGKFMSKDFEEVMGLLHEILTEAEFREEELKNVKKEVLSELRMKDDDPVSYVFKKFNAFVYEGHPYEKDPLGRTDDVLAITVEDLKRTYVEHVSPKNCVLAISGDVGVNDARKLIESLFLDWSGPKKELKRDKVLIKRGEAHFKKNMLQSHIVVGFPSVSLTDDERFAVEVIDAILSGMGGRIYHVLRERNPFAYATTFFNQMGYDTGAMGIYAAFDPKMLKDVKDTINKEIETILKEGFSEEEVERAKRYLIGNYLVSMQLNSQIAFRMVVDTFYGLGPSFFKNWPDRISRISKVEVDRAAEKYLRLENAATIVVGKRF